MQKDRNEFGLPATMETGNVSDESQIQHDAKTPEHREKRYIGTRTPDECVVVVVAEDGSEEPLNPRFDLRKHSLDGFNWGYSGSGPAQLALALLADALGDDERAYISYQEFKFKVVARLERDDFELTQAEICQKVASLEAEKGNRR